MSFDDEVNAFGPRDVDDYKPNSEDLDVEPRWVKLDRNSPEVICQWRWTWEAPGTKRQPYVGKWVASKDLALAVGREWLRAGSL